MLCQDEDSAVEAEEENPAVEPETEPETDTEPEPEPAEPEPDPGTDEYSDAGPVGDDVTETSGETLMITELIIYYVVKRMRMGVFFHGWTRSVSSKSF